MTREFLHSFLVSLMHLERRTEPFWRPYANAALREPSAAMLQALLGLLRKDEDMKVGEEKLVSGEDAALDAIVHDITEHMKNKYRLGEYERGAGAKTHGIVRAEVQISSELPAALRHGIFKEPRTFPAWVRFSGFSPNSPPDIEDVGLLSMSVKLMGVPGPKLLDDEKNTQDLLAITTPTFMTPDVLESAELQRQLLRRTPLYYFLNLRHPRLLDLLMQSLWTETQTSPLEAAYYSCTPYLLGQGRAMQFAFRPRAQSKSSIPNLPGRPPDHYLRDNMAATLRDHDWLFDLMVQVQTDAHAMPIENAAIRWPQKMSPYVTAATIRIPRQRFDSPAQLRFAQTLSYSPWHCVPEHRPLGSQNRARRRIYWELARLRASKNRQTLHEPTGRETFDEDVVPIESARSARELS